MNSKDAFLTVSEAAAMLRYSPTHVRRLVHAGIIPAVKVNGGRKFLIIKHYLTERI